MSNDKRSALVYGSYDFSNSGYALSFQSFLFPLLLAGASTSGDTAVLWGGIVAASSLIAVLLGPYSGRFADRVGRGAVFAVLVVATGLVASASPLAFEGRLWALAISFLVFNTLFELSQTIYDSFLLDFRRGNAAMTRLSTFAWGFGYVGGSVFAIAYLLLDRQDVSEAKSLFVLGSLFLLFSIPAVIAFARRRPLQSHPNLQFADLVKVKSPVPWRDLLTYWIIADAVGAVLYFTPLYMRQELGLSTATLGGLVLATQLLAFPLTIFMGSVAVKIGTVKTIRLSLVVWILGLTGLYLATNVYQLIPSLVALALVFGSTQALIRSHFASRVMVDRQSEGFGFFAVAQKSAAVVSPALIAFMSWKFGSLRPAYLVLVALMLVALLLSRGLLEPDPTEVVE